MGTKNDPGTHDCYAKAEPDEPLFVLLARDPLAPALVRLWSNLNSARGSLTPKTVEAQQVAADMEQWRFVNRP